MKVNDITIFFLAFLYLIPVLISESVSIDLAVVVISSVNLLILKRYKFKTMLYFLLIILLPIVSVFITTLLYTKPSNGAMIKILSFNLNEYSFNLAVFLSLRTFALSYISFSYLVALEYDKLILSLMQNLKLPVSVGYSLLVTFNAFYHLKDEFARIKNAYKMRYNKKRFALLLFIPIVVSAARYAYYAGLSLEARGLNSRKTFLHNYKWNSKDLIIFLINFMIIVAIIINYIFFTSYKIKLM